MKLTRYTINFLILFMTALSAFSQDSSAVIHPKKNSTTLSPGVDTVWEKFLRKNVDSTAPYRNKAKEGSYTVVVRFILAKDGTVSDVTPETHHGGGMEEAVIMVMKKWSPWRPAQKNPDRSLSTYHRVSYTFVVTKKKGFLRRWFRKN